MTNQTTYLVPGLHVTLGEQRGGIHFTQFPGRLRKATPARLALVDAINGGNLGSHDGLFAELAERFNAPLAGVTNFLHSLTEAGYVTDTAPPPQYFGEASGASASASTDEVIVATPVSLVAESGCYHWYGHDGKLLLRLSMPEVIAVSLFTEAITVEDACKLYLEAHSTDGLDRGQLDDLITRLAGAGLLIEPPPADDYVETPLFGTVDQAVVQSMVDARVAAHDESMINAGSNLVPVTPVNTKKGMAPASLGLVMAYAMDYEDGRLNEKYDFVPMFLTDKERIVERAAATPGIFIFSNYLWTVDENLELSAAIKAVSPASITIHGGPSTPSYERDCEMFFKDNPHVDVAVRGEGEWTFADMLDAIDLHAGNLDVLRNVDGLSYRTAEGVQRTGNRERIADLNTIPSPYLKGLFDEFGSVSAGAVIESNRGCPYGCTFCDWGSATLSKVRRFDLDRVYAELEWSAKHQIEDASIADANFGMLERDVAITEKIADLKRNYGYPRSVAINYAKNQVKYLRRIIDIMADVEILTEGVVSLQSMDETTLKVIDRSNIKLEKYAELSTEFRRARLPLAADIMMGLPGSTTASFSSDLQKCADLDIRVRANKTTLLPNSPMNEPEYRKKHGIVALPGEIVMEAASYTREEWMEMDRLRFAYYIFDGYGLVRYIARFVRRETGMGEVELYDKVRSAAWKNPQEWPVVSGALKNLEGYMAPPGSWGLFVEEVRRFLVDSLGIADDSALRTAIAVQLAHLPTPGRQFPAEVELEHDYAAWQDALLTTREEGHRDDWEKHIPRLSDFGPAILTIDDPNEICRRDIGKHKYVLDMNLRSWELESPVARPRLGSTSNIPKEAAGRH